MSGLHGRVGEKTSASWIKNGSMLRVIADKVRAEEDLDSLVAIARAVADNQALVNIRTEMNAVVVALEAAQQRLEALKDEVPHHNKSKPKKVVSSPAVGQTETAQVFTVTETMTPKELLSLALRSQGVAKLLAYGRLCAADLSTEDLRQMVIHADEPYRHRAFARLLKCGPTEEDMLFLRNHAAEPYSRHANDALSVIRKRNSEKRSTS